MSAGYVQRVVRWSRAPPTAGAFAFSDRFSVLSTWCCAQMFEINARDMHVVHLHNISLNVTVEVVVMNGSQRRQYDI